MFMSYSIPWLARPYPLLSTESSIFLRTMLPEKMIIPSVVLKLHNSIGQGQEVNTHLLFTVWPTHGQLLSPSEHLISWERLLDCALIFISGEFGVVYKAQLQWHPTELFAVKTLKGIPFKHHLYERIQHLFCHSFRSLHFEWCWQSGRRSSQNAHSQSP